MNLNSRISRMEAADAAINPEAIIVAADEPDYFQQLEDVLLRAAPGRLTITGTIAGAPFKRTSELLRHEDALELLS